MSILRTMQTWQWIEANFVTTYMSQCSIIKYFLEYFSDLALGGDELVEAHVALVAVVGGHGGGAALQRAEHHGAAALRIYGAGENL